MTQCVNCVRTARPGRRPELCDPCERAYNAGLSGVTRVLVTVRDCTDNVVDEFAGVLVATVGTGSGYESVYDVIHVVVRNDTGEFEHIGVDVDNTSVTISLAPFGAPEV